MGKPLEFKYPAPAENTRGTTHIRIDTDVYEAIEKIARKCRISICSVATRLVRSALEDVVFVEVPLYEFQIQKPEK